MAWPTAQVQVAAVAPMSSIRTPPRQALRPLKRLRAMPTAYRATPVDATDQSVSFRPASCSRKGNTDSKAPEPNAQKEKNAADQGEPSSSRLPPSSSPARRLRARVGV